MLQEQPTNVRFTLLDRALDKIGVYGSERIQALKDAFKFIIDNVCPIEAKGLFSCFTNMTMEDWTSALDSKINKREQKEVMKSVEDYEPNLIEIMINSNYSKNAVDFWMKSGEG